MLYIKLLREKFTKLTIITFFLIMTNLDIAKAVNISAIFKQYGAELPPRGNAIAFWRGDTSPSVSIDRNTGLWHDFGTGEGGTILDLVMKIEGCSLQEAVKRINSLSFHCSALPTSTDADATKRTAGIIIQNVLDTVTSPPLIYYLAKRGINESVWREWCWEIRYAQKSRPQKEYYAIGFPVGDFEGWVLRGADTDTRKGFKGCTKQGYTYFQRGQKKLCIFEGFFDFLSFLSMPYCKNINADYLILNSVINSEKAIAAIKALPTQYEKIGLFLDSDTAGRKHTRLFRTELESVSDVSFDAMTYFQSRFRRYFTCKDINDVRIEQIKTGAIPRGKHIESCYYCAHQPKCGIKRGDWDKAKMCERYKTAKR